MCTINNPVHKTMIGAYCRRLARLRGADAAQASGFVVVCAPPRFVIVRASEGRRCRTRLGWRRRRVRLWYPLSPLPPKRGRRCRSRLGWPPSRAPSGNTVVHASMLGHHRSCIVVGASPLKNETLALWSFFIDVWEIMRRIRCIVEQDFAVDCRWPACCSFIMFITRHRSCSAPYTSTCSHFKKTITL